ncbi:MAG: elongation factor P lysine(34) lysyltransferase [Kangiella sp.]|nr:MAG: elongation factor P lysine(34) lysyltransferase [Kangiella sp.]
MSNLKNIIAERNQLFEQTRGFFKSRNVLEVDTALIRNHTVTDPYMSAYSVIDSKSKHKGYLQTSPEYAMKILLSKGSGDIFQLSKMFRAEENSPIHSSEFTLLEWYRIGFDHFDLIKETIHFIQNIVGEKTVIKFSYREIFISELAIDPFQITGSELEVFSRSELGNIPAELLFDNYLTLLFSEKIEPTFDPNEITVIHSYPESQASLAKTSEINNVITADRFEVYLGGLELANGFNELTDMKEQKRRFEEDNQLRKKLNLQKIELDSDLLSALELAIPNCSGVALGLDRLLMIKTGSNHISDVIL